VPDVTEISAWESDLSAYVDRETDRLLDIIRDLVRIPSENTPPFGGEAACQAYVTDFLGNLGLAPDVYLPTRPQAFDGILFSSTDESMQTGRTLRFETEGRAAAAP
jgi:hypothetical protein